MAETEQPVPSEQPAQPQYHVNEQLILQRIDALKEEQNLPLGLLGGAVGGLLGAVIWAAVSYFTEYQIGWLAVGVGFLAGFGARLLGKGIDRIYGILGGVIALVSVLVGNLLANFGFLAKALEMTYFETLLNFRYEKIFDFIAATFSPLDILFYAIAIYAGYRYAFRKVSEEQLLEGAVIEVKKPE